MGPHQITKLIDVSWSGNFATVEHVEHALHMILSRGVWSNWQIKISWPIFLHDFGVPEAIHSDQGRLF